MHDDAARSGRRLAAAAAAPRNSFKGSLLTSQPPIAASLVQFFRTGADEPAAADDHAIF